MSNRLLSSIADALALVKQAKVTDATALLQRALTGTPARTGVSADLPRRPLGEVVRALRTGRPAGLRAKSAPRALQPDGNFAPRQYAGKAGSIGYWLHVPEGHAREDLALVLMLHGCTQNPGDFAAGTRMNALADEYGLVVAYPHQTGAANPNGCWNWFLDRNQTRGSGEPAVLAGLRDRWRRNSASRPRVSLSRDFRRVARWRIFWPASITMCFLRRASIPACRKARRATCLRLLLR